MEAASLALNSSSLERWKPGRRAEPWLKRPREAVVDRPGATDRRACFPERKHAPPLLTKPQIGNHDKAVETFFRTSALMEPRSLFMTVATF